MKTRITKHLFLIVLCSIIFTFLPMHVLAKKDFSITEMTKTGTLSTSTLNVRSGPSQDYDSIGKVSSSDSITITGQASTGWYRIDFNGEDGYISDAYVTLSSGAAPDEANSFSNYIEESEAKPLNYKLIIIIAVIVLVVLALIISTIKIFRNPEEENEDDDDDDDDSSSLYEEEELPVAKPRKKAADPMKESTTIVRGDDYRIYIDPRYFEEEKKPAASPAAEPNKKDLELEDAMNKLNELQQEIERLKNQRDS